MAKYTKAAKERCKNWFEMLIKKLGLGFHPDTRFEDYIEFKSGKRTYTNKEAKLLDERMERVFEEVKDPYAIAEKICTEKGLIENHKTSKKGKKTTMGKAKKKATKAKATKKATKKTKATKKKAIKKTNKNVPSIRRTMIDLMLSKGIDNVTYEETLKIAKSIKKDTAWKKTHFYYYRKIVRGMKATPKPARRKKDVNKKGSVPTKPFASGKKKKKAAKKKGMIKS